MENLDIYNKSREVPQEALKPITAGRLKGMSDINPMWRIKKLTELFGPCGTGWWYEITGKEIVDDATTKQRSAFVDIVLYYDGCTHGIPGTGGASFVAQERNGAYLSDECFKMALTDAISVAAKALGIGADVYFAKDATKYSEDAGARNANKDDNAQLYTCDMCGKTLAPYKDKNGKEIGVRQHVNGSISKFGRVYCIDCIMSDRSDEKPC